MNNIHTDIVYDPKTLMSRFSYSPIGVLLCCRQQFLVLLYVSFYLTEIDHFRHWTGIIKKKTFIEIISHLIYAKI